MARQKLVAGNWKMNGSLAEARALAVALSAGVGRSNAEVIVCPPFVHLSAVISEIFDGIQVGAQDCFWASKGAFTGNISVPMLADLGVTACIIGHSETRGKFGKLETPESTLGYFAETNATLVLKGRALLEAGITPILCCGETLDEREAGQTESVIEAQIHGGLEGFSDAEKAKFVIAYEPVWAIGTGKTCPADEAQRVCQFIRGILGAPGESMRILYGGSVKAANAKELFSQPDIDGGLVGGASLDPAEFIAIIESA